MNKMGQICLVLVVCIVAHNLTRNESNSQPVRSSHEEGQMVITNEDMPSPSQVFSRMPASQPAPPPLQVAAEIIPTPTPAPQEYPAFVCRTHLRYCLNSSDQTDFDNMFRDIYSGSDVYEKEESMLVRCVVSNPNDCDGGTPESVNPQSYTEADLAEIHKGSILWLKNDLKAIFADSEKANREKQEEEQSDQPKTIYAYTPDTTLSKEEDETSPPELQARQKLWEDTIRQKLEEESYQGNN